jgi:hypothetical protein
LVGDEIPSCVFHRFSTSYLWNYLTNLIVMHC